MNRRQLLTCAPLALAPSLLAFGQDAPNTTPKPLPKNLVDDMKLVLPILLPKLRTKTATAEQVLHLALLFDWYGRELTACHWDPPLTSIYTHASLKQLHAGMPAFTERIYSMCRHYDPGLTLADTRYVGQSILNIIVNGPVNNSGAKTQKVSFQALQKAKADATALKTGTALKTLSRSPLLEGNSPDAVTPDYLFDACGEVGFASGFFGGLGVIGVFVPFMEPAVPFLDLTAFGLWLGFEIFCT